MNIAKTCLALFLFFAPFSTTNAQTEKMFSAKKLKKDYRFLLKQIEAHPDPYTNISEPTFKRKTDSIAASINEEMDLMEFYKKTAQTIALLRDGHSSTRLPKEWLKKKRKDFGAFPYEVYLNNEDELYILKNHSEDGIPKAAKILSINGISVAQFINQIDPYISYELPQFRNTIIDQQFEKYLYLHFGKSDNTQISYLLRDTMSHTVQNMPYKEWKKQQKNTKEKWKKLIEDGQPYEYENLGNGIGKLSIYAFYARDIDYYGIFLSDTFRKIREEQIHSLIIDVRGNFGGWPKIASYLFHYISNGHFKTQAKSTFKVSQALRNSIFAKAPALASTNFNFERRRHYIDMDALINDPIGTYVDEDIFFNEKPIKKDFEFTGDCYLLTNRDSYSAASSFASTFQCYLMGSIIGEETGGTKIFRANPMNETLAKTDISLSLSTTKLYNTCYNNEFEGVQANIKYVPTILELTSEMDTHLHYAIRVINKVRKKKEQAAEKN